MATYSIGQNVRVISVGTGIVTEVPSEDCHDYVVQILAPKGNRGPVCGPAKYLRKYTPKAE